jgi:hypothetical protein
MPCEPSIPAVPKLRLHLLRCSPDHAIPEQQPFELVSRVFRSRMLRQMSRRGFGVSLRCLTEGESGGYHNGTVISRLPAPVLSGKSEENT